MLIALVSLQCQASRSLLARLKRDRILLPAEKHDFRGAFETPYTPRFYPDENEAVSLVHQKLDPIQIFFFYL